MDLLCADYPGLIKQAINEAKGGDNKVLMQLVELLPKMVRLEDDQVVPATAILNAVILEVHRELKPVVVEGVRVARHSPDDTQDA